MVVEFDAIIENDITVTQLEVGEESKSLTCEVSGDKTKYLFLTSFKDSDKKWLSMKNLRTLGLSIKSADLLYQIQYSAKYPNYFPEGEREDAIKRLHNFRLV